MGAVGENKLTESAASLDGGHDLEVLEGAVGCVVVGVAAGDARAMAHGDRGGGQLHQALVLPVHRQLVCRPRDRRKPLKMGSQNNQIIFLCLEDDVVVCVR